jgi:glycerol kinase
MAYQTKEVFDLMGQESGLRIKTLAVDGGACQNNFLMQFQADILGVSIARPLMVDTTVAGAAYLAGVTVGLWDPRKVQRIKTLERTFRPKMPRAEVKAKCEGWKHAVRQALA